MYNLSYFNENDPAVVKEFMQQHPFAMLTGCSKDNKPVATQVPVFIDEKEGKYFLTGHIMRKTDHHIAFVDNPNVLALFTGPHAYVSGSWYNNPAQASTWNYMTVHAKGVVRFGNEEELIEVLKRLTLHYENNNSNSPTIFDNLSSQYLAPLMKAIVAFEIEITSVENVFKLSQNRDEKSYDNIISNLEKQGGDALAIATIMKNRKTKVFQK